MAKHKAQEIPASIEDHCEIILKQLHNTLVERGANYGSFFANSFTMENVLRTFADTTFAQQFAIKHDLPADIAEVLANALTQIASKLSRISQTPMHEDFWLDIAGYAILANAALRMTK